MKKYEEYKKAQNAIKEAKSLVNDPELREMAELELAENTAALEKIKS